MIKTAVLVSIIIGAALPHLPDGFALAHLFQSFPIGVYAVLCGLSAGIAAVVFRRRAAISAAALILASWSVAASAMMLRENSPAAGKDGLSIITWNTHYWDQLDGPENFADQLRQMNADVVLLQEHIYRAADSGRSRDIDDADALKTCCGFEHVWSKGELVIASRLPGTPIPVDDPYVQVVSLRSGSDTVDVINVHVPVHVNITLSPTQRAFWSFVVDRHQSRLASYAELERVLAATDRAIVGGDFNSTVLMRPLRDALFAYTDMGIADLWPPTYPTGKSLPELWRLDILVGRNTGARRCSVMPMHPTMGSDHRPVRCEFAAAT
ncbi:MAG: endonuclease/exonuclease/phosphatase family protein [Pseudomonadota bacterium]